jgi:hypothetical protein
MQLDEANKKYVKLEFTYNQLLDGHEGLQDKHNQLDTDYKALRDLDYPGLKNKFHDSERECERFRNKIAKL